MAILDDLVNQARKLSPTEQLQLIKLLVEQTQISQKSIEIPRRWMELKGVASHPLVNEDAQTWVSEQRHASDARRQQNLRGES